MIIFQGEVLKEQGITFAIVIVKKYVIDNSFESKKAIHFFQGIFQGIPVVIMAQDFQGVPVYYGRPDLVNFLVNVPFEAIPWMEYTYS